ncbi:hypothetical protein S40293_03178 [Stachybotrys chartarum IBT 40293]|nr:hypothetical protein S40293_03178 [Stachybotrys chartarum IBT 40293]
MFEAPTVSFESGQGFSIVGAVILVDGADFEGVRIAVQNLSQDFGKVAGIESIVQNTTCPSKANTTCIVIGSTSQSSIINALRDSGKLDTSGVDGKWETWMTTTVENPFEGYSQALVIVGSDKRGTIYGTYSLSEQIGISPWHWWADVPPKRHPAIYALPISTVNGEPSIKYRGIFINDEAPAMDSWAHEKFGPKFNTELYGHIFELLLRLKANFMWPAMWRGYPYPGRSFFVDDPSNQKLADTVGIVMGTSHHEPMQRAMNEWSTTQPEGTWNWETNKSKVRQYFEEGAARAEPFESYMTIGMRGEGDGPISGSNPVATLTDVIANQRDIFKDVYGNEDGPMQALALYKEVQSIYDDGLEVPDDVTLLFADDNFGSLRRLPNDAEIERKGGIGFYYHFQYTGSPRSYRWMNSNNLGKAWQQLQLGYHECARELWIFNVGDLKPQEVPMSFAFDLAWNVNAIGPDTFLDYYTALATREFGSQYSEAIARLWYEYDRLVALRKHEHIEPETFSLLKYHEAETVVSRWGRILEVAESIRANLSPEQQPAFFQLVLYPIKASYTFVRLRVTQYRNQLYAKQRRNTTNALFHRCISLFDADHDLVEEYHSILDGKWNHMLRQPHYGFTSSWMGPSRNMISGLCYVQTKEDSNPSVGHMGIAVEGTEGINPGLINEDSDRTHPSRKWLQAGVTLPYISPYGVQSRYFEVFHRGTRQFTWEATPQYAWIKLSQYQGTLAPGDDDVRVNITIDWARVPVNFDQDTTIEIVGSVDGYELVHLNVKNRRAPADFTGFVETDGYVSIDAGNWVTSPYLHLPAVGRPIGGAVTLPYGIDLSNPDAVAFLRYPFYVFTERDNANLELQFTMTLDTHPDKFLEFDLRWDEGDVETFRLTSPGNGDLPMGWSAAVQDCVWKRNHNLGRVNPGPHVIEVRFRSTNICLEKLLVDLGQVKITYLGPAESEYVGKESSLAESVGSEDGLDIRLRI